MVTNYTETITTLRGKCGDYRTGKLSLDDFKKAVWAAAEQIESSDEYDLRLSLQSIEGRLDMVQFTVDQAKVSDASLEIVQELENLIGKVT